jgi:hypothetical protein
MTGLYPRTRHVPHNPPFRIFFFVSVFSFLRNTWEEESVQVYNDDATDHKELGNYKK